MYLCTMKWESTKGPPLLISNSPPPIFNGLKEFQHETFGAAASTRHTSNGTQGSLPEAQHQNYRFLSFGDAMLLARLDNSTTESDL